jgi:hypothetical protein
LRRGAYQFATLALALALASTPAHAQKTFISQCSGSAILFKANGTIIKTLGIYPVGFGDIIATGNDGSAELVTSGGFRATLASGTVVTFVYSGPLASSRAVIELVTGTVSFSDSGNGLLSPTLSVDGTEKRASAGTRVATVAPDGEQTIADGAIEDRMKAIAAEIGALEPRYALATESLMRANGRYRDLLAAENEADIAAFREETLYPAEDARSEIIGEISRRETLLRAIRLFVLAPRHMREKSAHPFEYVSAGAVIP